jgi:predicted neuraminidase
MSLSEFLLPTDHARFGQCHASTIVPLAGGDLLVAFFAGTREGEGDTAIWTARRRDGKWDDVRCAMEEPGVPHWNPVLHAEGDDVWLFYKVGATVHNWITRWARSRDGGRSWSTPSALVPGDASPRGPVKNKLVVMSNGEWLAPGSVETASTWDAFVDASADRGRRWRQYPIPITHEQPGRTRGDGPVWSGLATNALWENNVDTVFAWDGVIQPTLWESKSGTVHALMRSTRGRIFRSDSSDYGRTWCPAYATQLPNNNSGIDAVRVDGGRIVLVHNPVEGNWGQRYPLSLTVSHDDGAHWHRLLDLEAEAGEFSYPAVIAQGNRLHVTWTWNRRTIAYRCVSFDG